MTKVASSPEVPRLPPSSGATRALGHHWGTFHLTNEPAEQPSLDLAAALTRRGVAPERFVALRPGAVHVV